MVAVPKLPKAAGCGREVLNPVGCPKLLNPVTGGPVPVI